MEYSYYNISANEKNSIENTMDYKITWISIIIIKKLLSWGPLWKKNWNSKH